jgi:hypothetical protein
MPANTSLFTKKHYESVTGLADPKLTELVIHCLELVEQLQATGLPFRFKGGNSLLLILPHPERFSNDVDIATGASKDEVIRAVESIVTARCASPGALHPTRFTRYEVRAHKTKPWLLMISFKLFFKSFYQSDEDAFVMLDAVLRKSPYPGIMRPIVCGDIYQTDTKVETPTTSGLIADKLLTLGPSTLGIPLGKGKEAQRLKHVFDITSLLHYECNIDNVREALLPCIEQEADLQRKNIKFQDIRQDTLAFLAETRGLNDEICTQALAEQSAGSAGSAADLSPENLAEAYRYEILRGFHEFCAYLFRTKYTWKRLEEDAASIATLLEKL